LEPGFGAPVSQCTWVARTITFGCRGLPAGCGLWAATALHALGFERHCIDSHETTDVYLDLALLAVRLMWVLHVAAGLVCLL
jgi:hypothetical protein